MVERIVVRFKSRAELLNAYTREGPLGGIFVAGHSDLRTGQVVLLELVLEEEKDLLHTAGLVRWKRTKSSPQLLGGVGVEFAPDIPLGDDRTPLLEKLPEPYAEARRGTRYPVSLAAAYQILGVTIHRNLTDVSRSGGFLKTDIPPSVGMIFPVTLSQGKTQSVDLTVTSVRRELDNDSHKVRGVGFEFVTNTPREQEYISRIMANVAIRHLSKK